MHAVIVGCSRVGAELAQAFEARSISVSIIDSDPHAFEQRLHPGFHGNKIIGIGFDRETLEKAGINQAEIFVSATRGDNTNIVSARIAKEHYDTPNVAALIYDPRRVQIYERLGIMTVATVSWTTDQLLARVLPTVESVEWTIGAGEVVVIGVPAPQAMIGQPIDELKEFGKVAVVAVTRLGKTQIPDKKTLIQEGDFIHLSILRSSQTELDERLGAAGEAGTR